MAKTMAKQVLVSKRATIQRINRALAKSDQQLKACRSNSQWHRDLGDYYVVDLSRNGIVGTDIDLGAYGRELGVLAAWETVADE